MTATHHPVCLDEAGKLALRKAFGSFATGVTVVTTRQPDGTPRGFTANSFTSVSLDPPLVLVCLAKTALSCSSFTQAEHFAVNILADHQREVSGLFASKSADKFDIASWFSGPQSIPLIDDALCSLTCARHQVVDAGDHIILIGRVETHTTRDGNPLGFFRGAYFDIGLEDRVTDVVASGSTVSIGALLTQGDDVLLSKQPNGSLTIPKADPAANTIEQLEDALLKTGLEVSLGHLYAVFHDTQSGSHSIIFHGEVRGTPPSGLAYFELASLSTDDLTTHAEQAMLARFQQEFRHGSFGLYQGSEICGQVHTLTRAAPR